ncbi:hypothetical protein CA606_00760 [Caulobacter vibrioides]|uniref:Uncharacterized protein n=1 Tax=Caulobacter vibrioides TaxID=155892 RepID=A0A290MQ12_CAUVI|nr:hypothetical protein [Caulobacter vibrioides]ATC30993.1 hypothetical protein CA606_00760 [Caulobacter vibrioides]
MSALDDFMLEAKAYGKATLDDHLTQQGYLDPAKRKSMRAQATRALKKGGTYRALAEQGVIVPATNSRGRKGGWEEGLKAQDSKLPTVLASEAFRPIRDLDLERTPIAMRQQVGALMEMNLTGRVGAQVAQTVTTLAYEYQMERDSHEHAQQLYEMEQKHHTETKQTLDRILALLEGGEARLVPTSERKG